MLLCDSTFHVIINKGESYIVKGMCPDKQYLISCILCQQRCVTWSVYMACVRHSAAPVSLAGVVPCVTSWSVTNAVPLTATATMAPASASLAGMAATVLSVSKIQYSTV